MTDRPEAFAGPGPEAIYEEGLTQGVFRIQRCRACGAHVFYPRALCLCCQSPDLEWVTASGRATVHATSVVRQKPEDGGDYNIALVDLEEGPRMLTRVVDIAPEQVRIGMQVMGSVGAVDGEPAVLFRPSAGGPR
ncbi:MAG: OB-fold domain-containing protein [Gammaproteobacteria bacterium]|nr:OB-fold domain-containing protein [Gammaproteobacteria bacterium]